MDRMDAKAALEAARKSDEWLERHARWPLWRHAAAGALQGLFVIIWAVPMPLAGALMVAALGGVFLIVASDRRTHGFFVNGWSSPAARPAVLLAMAITLLGFAAVILAGDGINRWTPVAPWIAIAVTVGVTLASIWWERLYRRDLRQGARHDR